MEIKALDHIITRAMRYNFLPFQTRAKSGREHLKGGRLYATLTEHEVQEKLAALTSRVPVKWLHNY